MNIKQYCKDAFSTSAILGSDWDNTVHMLFGMSTEVGELTDAYKRYLAYGTELDYLNVQEEIGDLCWYIANFCTFNDFDLEEILRINIEKLKTRYPEKFTQKDAVERDLQKERDTLIRK